MGCQTKLEIDFFHQWISHSPVVLLGDIKKDESQINNVGKTQKHTIMNLSVIYNFATEKRKKNIFFWRITFKYMD